MTMPRIYSPDGNEPKKMPMLTVTEAEKGILAVHAVDEEGNYLAGLFDSLGTRPAAEEALEEHGYSTDWAEWTQEGQFKHLK